MSTERTGGISIIGGGEMVTTSEERDKGDRVGKEEPGYVLEARVQLVLWGRKDTRSTQG